MAERIPLNEKTCAHGVRWPHPCRDCEDEPAVSALQEEFRNWPHLAVEVSLLAANQSDRNRFPYMLDGELMRRRLFALGLVNSHGWLTAKGRDAEILATPFADAWARRHGAATFAAYLAGLAAKEAAPLEVDRGA